MALQNVNFNFSQGLNTKTDPWQLPIGQFDMLQNSIFQKGGLLQKRPGYSALAQLAPNQYYLTTLNNNLVAINNTVNAYSSTLENWITKGTLQPCALNVLPLIRNNLSQVQNDTVVANGLVLTTYTQQNTTTSAVVTQYMYAIADVTTGQNIVPPTAIVPLTSGTISGSSRTFVVGNYFVIVSPVTVSSNVYLQYCAIPINNPVNFTTNTANVGSSQNVTSEIYTPITSNPGWDAVAVNSSTNNLLVVAYNTTTGAQGVHVASLTLQQIAANDSSSVIHDFTSASYIGAVISICVDTTLTTPIYYVSFWNNSTQNGYTAAVTVGYASISVQFTPQQIITSTNVVNLASAAQNGSCLVFSEVYNTYSYDSALQTDYINAVTVSSAGTVGTPYVAIRSVGLASKAFIVNGTVYFLAAQQSTYQPSYFLMNGSTTTSASPIIVSQLAYSNGNGYCTLGLPSVTITNGIAQLSYLYKDDVEALNTLNNTQQTTAGGIYSQEGINLVSFNVGTAVVDTVEIGNNLHLSGGYLSHFDGYLPVEHNFFLWPELDVTQGTSPYTGPSAVYTEVSTKTPTGTASNGSKTIVVSSATGIFPGMTISDTTNPSYIPANTSVITVNGTTVTMSAATTHAISGDTLSIQGNIAAVPTGAAGAGAGLYYWLVTYEYTDNQGLPYRSQANNPISVTTVGSGATGIVTLHIPTLRLTAKVANVPKIVVYRWSENTQVYNQVTSITAPLLNDTTIDSVTFVDTLSDANVIGNNIIYTTGNVPGDFCAPSSSIMTLFNAQLCMVNAEDPNTILLSKQVVEGTPVEMTPTFTIYVAPTIGALQSSGPITALAPMDDKLIIFKKDAIYYINGTPPPISGATQNGCSLGGYSQPIFITNIVGCTNQSSIVLTDAGLMFQSDKGIYILPRGLGDPDYIGSDVEDFNGYTVNSAQIIPETNYLLFTLTGTNQFLMYDWYYKQWGTFVGLSAISSCIYEGQHTIIDIYGRILQQTPGQYLDGSDPVLMSFTLGWFNLASLQGYQRFKDFYILANYLSPHSLLCQVSYNYVPSVVHSKLITPQNFSQVIPGPFGVPTPFGAPQSKEQWRVHAKQQLCESFQLSITEVFNPQYGTIAGAGFTMSGITARVDVKKGTRPIPGKTSAGLG